jgi:hypothetical protein
MSQCLKSAGDNALPVAEFEGDFCLPWAERTGVAKTNANVTIE